MWTPDSSGFEANRQKLLELVGPEAMSISDLGEYIFYLGDLSKISLSSSTGGASAYNRNNICVINESGSASCPS